MKNNQQEAYEKYMQEIWDIKEDLYQNFLKSGCKTYVEFIQKQNLQKNHSYYITQHPQKKAA